MSTYCLTSAGFVAVIKEVKLLLGPGLCELEKLGFLKER